jgi:hypothetical protein
METIPRIPFNFADTFTLPSALFHLLSNVKGGSITNGSRAYRVGHIVIELLNYIIQEDLFDFPSTVLCDASMRAAFGISQFQLAQITDIIYSMATLDRPLGLPPHQEFTLRIQERAEIMRLVFTLSQKRGFFELF